MNAYVREYKKIERRARRRDNFLIRYLPIVLLAAGGAVVGKIYLQSVTIEWTDRVVRRNAVARELALGNDEMRRALAALTTRERVAQDAGDRLGMVVPTEEDIVWLPVVDRSSRPAAPARGAEEDRGAGATVYAWLDALWQEEALALTSE